MARDDLADRLVFEFLQRGLLGRSRGVEPSLLQIQEVGRRVGRTRMGRARPGDEHAEREDDGDQVHKDTAPLLGYRDQPLYNGPVHDWLLLT
jgi:hypothetical protein